MITKQDEDHFHVGVKALIINPEGQMLLLLAKQPAKVFWDLPGGRMCKGEDSFADAPTRIDGRNWVGRD